MSKNKQENDHDLYEDISEYVSPLDLEEMVAYNTVLLQTAIDSKIQREADIFAAFYAYAKKLEAEIVRLRNKCGESTVYNQLRAIRRFQDLVFDKVNQVVAKTLNNDTGKARTQPKGN